MPLVIAVLVTLFFCSASNASSGDAMSGDPLSVCFGKLKAKYDLLIELPSPEDLSAIENAIGFSLPNDLRRFCLAVSNLAFELYDPATSHGGADSDLCRLIKSAWCAGIPVEWFAFCSAEGGYFCINKETQKVKFSSIGFTTEEYEDLADWIRKIYLSS